MATICDYASAPEVIVPTQQCKTEIEEKWLNYSQVYTSGSDQFLYFDELGTLTNGKKRGGPGRNGKKRGCPGRKGSGPIYPSKEAGDILYASLTPDVPIKLTSESSMDAISEYFLPQARQVLNHYKLGLSDGKLFEGYVSPKGKGKWSYVTPTKETTFKECWVKLENCGEGAGVVGDAALEVKQNDSFKDNALPGLPLQFKKQSSILNFFSKISKENAKETLEIKTTPITPKVGSVKSSNRRKRKCAQMNLTPISKPRRKLPRRKMNWSPIPIKQMCSSPERVVTPRSPSLSPYIPMTPRLLVETPEKAETVDSEIDSALKMIRKSLRRTKFIRDKYSKVFDAVQEESDKVPISELRKRFHVPISGRTLETFRNVGLPEDVLEDIFSLGEDYGESINYLVPNGTSSTEFFSLLPDHANLSSLISFEDFDDIDALGDIAEDGMDGFNNIEISSVI